MIAVHQNELRKRPIALELLALIIVLINFIVDLLYLYLNPQVRIN